MEKTRHYSWLLALFSTLAAVAFHGYLSFKFYALRFGALGQASACNFNELWNCDAVSASSYAQFLGVPMALWGMTVNLILVAMLILSRMSWVEGEDRSQRYSAWFAGIIFIASVVMGIISATLLKSLCLFCVITYLLSIVTVVAVFIWARPKILPNFADDIRALFVENRGALVAFLLVPALAFFFNSVFIDNFQGEKMTLMATEKVSQWASSPPQVFNGQGLVEFKGSGIPKMEIIEFADFRCPHCKEAFFALDAFASSHPDVKLTFKYFPLDGTCNPEPAMKSQGDGISCEAAFAVHCAEKLSQKGWAAHHAFFNQQEVLQSMSSKDEVSDFICKETKTDCKALKDCVGSLETRTAVQGMAAEGISAGIRGTPGIFVNNRVLLYGQFLPVLEKAYQSLKSN